MKSHSETLARTAQPTSDHVIDCRYLTLAAAYLSEVGGKSCPNYSYLG